MHLQRKQNIVKCRVEWPRPSLCSGPRNTGVYTHDTDDTAHTGDREVHLGFNLNFSSKAQATFHIHLPISNRQRAYNY